MYICTATALKSTAGEFDCFVSFAEQKNGVMLCTICVLESIAHIQKPTVGVTFCMGRVVNCTACGPRCTVYLLRCLNRITVHTVTPWKCTASVVDSTVSVLQYTASELVQPIVVPSYTDSLSSSTISVPHCTFSKPYFVP